jgi:hypothetical protein
MFWLFQARGETNLHALKKYVIVKIKLLIKYVVPYIVYLEAQACLLSYKI